MVCLLKSWVKELIETFTQSGPSGFNDIYKRSGTKEGGMTMFDLFPSANRMRNILYLSCLSTSEEEFDDDCLCVKNRTRFRDYRSTEVRACDSSAIGNDTRVPNYRDNDHVVVISIISSYDDLDDHDENQFDRLCSVF